MIIDNDRKIYFTKRINAPVALVYSLWSEAENYPMWWSPNVKTVEMEFKEGGLYQVQWSHSVDPKQWPHGAFKKIIPLKEILMSWKWEAISPAFNSDILINFNDEGDSTLFEFSHFNFSVAKEVEPHHEAWTEIMDLLYKFSEKS